MSGTISIDLEYYLKENEKRKKALFAPYDPFKGLGSPIERKELFITEGESIFLPLEMFQESELVQSIQAVGSVYALASTIPGDVLENLMNIIKAIRYERVKYDFEFWAAECSRIQHKEKKSFVPFILRRPQLKLLKLLEGMRLAGVPARIIILKARQWGGSTLVQIYFSWLQIFRFKNWHSSIVAHLEIAAGNILNMYQNMLSNHPEDVFYDKLRADRFMPSTWKLQSRGNRISLSSMESPEKIRSQDISLAHLSEVGLWKKTAGKSPEDVVQALRPAVPDVPGTVFAFESTAKGKGFFYDEWENAASKDSAYEQLFVSWFEIDMYTIDLPDSDKAVIEFISSWNEQEKRLWSYGATLEGIYWYRKKKVSDKYSDTKMMQEYPSTPDEAFSTTGRRYFTVEQINYAKSTCMKPQFVGDLVSPFRTGKATLVEYKLVADPKGKLSIWSHPEQYCPETGRKINNRYIIFADVGGKSENSDKHAAIVLDRYPILHGGGVEVAAEYNWNGDPDLFAWDICRLGSYYNNALVGFEVNTLIRKHADADPDVEYSTFILDQIKHVYENLYHREIHDKQLQQKVRKVGFHTNKATKPMIIESFYTALRDRIFSERNKEAVTQIDYFEQKQDGTLGNVEGKDKHDDRVIIRAGGTYLAIDCPGVPAIKLAPSNEDVKKQTSWRPTSADL